MFFVYILQNKKDESFYIGYTQDLQKRLCAHNQGQVRYTKGHIPYEIVYVERFDTLRGAKDREVTIKKTKNVLYFLKKQTSSPDSPM